MKLENMIIALLIGISLHSCDYLGIVPDDTPVLADASRNGQTAEDFAFACYSSIPGYLNFRQNFSQRTIPETVGSAYWTTAWFASMRMQQGLYSSADLVIDIQQSSYNNIRQHYTSLNNIDAIKPSQILETDLAAKKVFWKGEVKFLITYYHYLLLQNYKPIVIPNEAIPLNAPKEELFRPRVPYDRRVNQIMQVFGGASTDLPMTVETSNYGCVTRVTAQVLGTRIYLYATGPQFNENVEIYDNFRDKDGQLLTDLACDEDKWKTAMDERKGAIGVAHQARMKLYKYTKKSNLPAFSQVIANARNLVVDAWDKELTWEYSGQKGTWVDGDSIQTHVIPKSVSTPSGAPYGTLGATALSADMYLTKNGLPMDGGPESDYTYRFNIAEGGSVVQVHRNRESRFYGSIGSNRGDYLINGDMINPKARFKEQDGTHDTRNDQLYGSYTITKPAHPKTSISGASNSLVASSFPIIRLGGLRLDYAEAYFEYSDTLKGNALTYFDLIRQGGGIPNMGVLYRGLPIDGELRKTIHREGAVELMLKRHISYDYRYWLIIQKGWSGVEGDIIDLSSYGTTDKERYKNARLDAQPFIFRGERHLSPIKQDHLNINSGLI